MNISFNSLAHHAVFFLRDKALPAFNAYQKKILAIVALALGCLAACCLIRHFYFKAEPLQNEENDLNQKDFLHHIFPNAKKLDKEKEEDIFDLDKDAETIANIANDKSKEAFQKSELYHRREITLSDGSIAVEEGEFQNGELHGQGKITYLDGAIVEGEFQNGELCGQGKIRFPSGAIVKGEFQNGQLHGRGKVTYSNGRIDEGEFQNSKLHGQGKRTYPRERIEEGEFKDGDLYKSLYPQIKTPKQQVKADNFNISLNYFPKDTLDCFGPNSVGLTEQYIWYMREFIFGFSIGQKKQIAEISKQSNIELNKLKRILCGGCCCINMLYITLYLEHFIPKLKDKKHDSSYVESLESLQFDLKRSLRLPLIIQNDQINNVVNKLSKSMYDELKNMKPDERFLIPFNIESHAILLILRKMTDGTIAFTVYNTGMGVEQHLTRGLNIQHSLNN